MTPADVVKFIKEKEAKYCDLRFTDTRGKEQHVTMSRALVALAERGVRAEAEAKEPT